MKKVLSIALVLIVIVGCFAGCAKPEKQIVGTWKTTKSELGVSIETTYVFNEDGTGSYSTIGKLSVDLSWTIADDKLSITTAVLGIESTTTYTYAFEKDTLTLTEGENVTVLTKAE